MGGKETSGSAIPPRAPLAPPEHPFHTPLFSDYLADSRRFEPILRWLQTSPVVDWLYVAGVVAVVVLAGCLLALA
jgi:hypothetical protein